MEVSEYEEQLEYDLTWRLEELTFFKNIGASIEVDEERERFNRVLILMLYAHFEGFFKLSLQVYVSAINSEGLKCSEVNDATAAAALADMFHDLRHPDKKCKEFPADLQDEPNLRIFGREQVFLRELNNFKQRSAVISDSVIDTESNLKPRVIRKNLFRLGLNYSAFDEFMNEIDQILNYRNNIAHGKWKKGLNQKKFDDFEDAALKVVKGIKDQIVSALVKGTYKNTA